MPNQNKKDGDEGLFSYLRGVITPEKKQMDELQKEHIGVDRQGKVVKTPRQAIEMAFSEQRLARKKGK